MAASPIDAVFRHLRKTVLCRDFEGVTDGQLLQRFIDAHDERAFEALVLRHGPMVLGVCRRVVGSVDDAEDAFQASFLILVRKGKTIGNPELLGNWLYGVAYRTALEARGKNARRRCHEIQVTHMPHPAIAADGDRSELVGLIDRELNRLPHKYRVPVVLCDLQGTSRREAARRLGIPEGTLSSRLASARNMLAKRLKRAGVTVSGMALATVLAQNAAPASVPAPLVLSTITAASSVAHASTVTTAVVSGKVAALTERVLTGMVLQQIKVLITLLLVVTGIAGSGLLAYRVTAGTGSPPSGVPGGDAPMAGEDRGTRVDDEAKDKAAREAAAREAAARDAEAKQAAAREAAAKAAREQQTPTVPEASDGSKVVDFEEVFISIRPFQPFAARQPETIRVLAGGARGDGFFEYRIEERPARGDAPKWDPAYLQDQLDLKRLKRLEDLLKKTAWLTAPGHEGRAMHTHPTSYTLRLKRHGKTQNITIEGERPDPYKSLLSFFRDVAQQEYLRYCLERLPAKEHNEACRQIEQYILAENGGPYEKPPPELDLRCYVPMFRRYVSDPFTHSREELVPAVRLLGHLHYEAERDNIAALANDRDAHIRAAVADALGALGGKESVSVLRRMVRSTDEASWQLIRLGPLSVPAIVEMIESGDPSNELKPGFLDYERLIRSYIDHWDRVTKPVDPRVLDAVRTSMAQPKVKMFRTQYHRKLLELAGLEPPGVDLPPGLEFLRPIPEFHKFRLGQDEATIRKIVAEQGLTISGSVEQGFMVTRRDGERLALSMRSGTCSGIQRLRKD
jgi:RNA polymerase sigma factor (sigma-70 family)